jgi:hypothetical protein
LPYRENTGITEDEYKTLLDSPSNMKMVNGKNISIKVTRDKDKLTLKVSGTTSFDEMAFNLMNPIEQLKAKAM